jgi:hypothetical protein
VITNNGKNAIKRYFSGQLPQIGGSIALGVGVDPAALTDVSLDYEVIRIPITSINADLSNDRVVFMGSVVPGSIKTIYEVGLYSSQIANLDYSSLDLFNQNNLAWTNGTLVTANSRANPLALKIDYVANGTTNAELVGVNYDLSRFKDIDNIIIGFYVSANLSSFRVRMGTDASNYYEFVNSTVSNGYNVKTLSRSAATKVGNPDWSNITYIAARPSATAAGPGSVYFDGVRIETNIINSDNILVSRTLLTTPIVVDVDVPSDVEYSLELSFL